MTEKEYLRLRVERNLIRDKFENSGSFLEASLYKTQIRQKDKILSKYEKDSK